MVHLLNCWINQTTVLLKNLCVCRINSLTANTRQFRTVLCNVQKSLNEQLKKDMTEENHNEVVHQLTQDNSEILAKKGALILKQGGVIATPTDTIYGLAADAQNSDAITRIYEIKGRDCVKPIAICVSSISQVYKWGRVTVPRGLLQDLLPGPVTLVFQRKPALNSSLNPHTNLIGIRIPEHRFINDLAKFHTGPVALTSANLSGETSALRVEEFKSLWPSLHCVFDGGPLCDGSEEALEIARAGSTVIDLSNKGTFRIIREGSAYDRCIEILNQKYKLEQQN